MIKDYAFPSEGFDSGMELRDYYAAKAMQAFIHEVYADTIADHGCDSIARKAYYMADAMLKARKK